MTHEDEPIPDEASAGYEGGFRIADLSLDPQIETIGLFLVTDHGLGRPVDIEQYLQVFSVPTIAAELGATEAEVEEAIAMSCDRLRVEFGYGGGA